MNLVTNKQTSGCFLACWCYVAIICRYLWLSQGEKGIKVWEELFVKKIIPRILGFSMID